MKQKGARRKDFFVDETRGIDPGHRGEFRLLNGAREKGFMGKPGRPSMGPDDGRRTHRIVLCDDAVRHVGL